MSDAANGSAPTGGKPGTLGGVSSWALRSLIEQTSGYGDAILEISKVSYAWNSQHTVYPNGNKPFFVYGGDYSSGALVDKRGMFSVSSTRW